MAGKGKTTAKSSHSANTPLAIESFKHTLTLFTATLKAQLNVHNTLGMNTSSHNAF